jgi:5,10-methylenetetrahydrofolate reductase
MRGNKFKEALTNNKFAITAEVGPPKGADTGKLKEHIEVIKDLVDGINVTDNQSANMKMSSLGVCAIIKQAGGEPIFQMTCRDRNRMAIGSDLLAAKGMDIHNILCLTGDYMHVGDHQEACPVFDLDSVQLLQGVTEMGQGFDFGGNKMEGAAEFFCGAAFTPSSEPIEPQILKLAKKVQAGASFIQTQAVFETKPLLKMKDYKDAYGETKVLAGILLLSSPGMAKFVNNNIPGINVPDYLIKELTDAPKGTRLKKGIEIAGRFIRQLKEENICDGVHIMAIGKEEKVPDILKEAGIV